MDVGTWLKSLGLGQYEALFRASDIDADILPELTEIDLEKLGGWPAQARPRELSWRVCAGGVRELTACRG
jgi:SAM domain (Sterile alpha motif)